jgi:hypothetical protein
MHRISTKEESARSVKHVEKREYIPSKKLSTRFAKRSLDFPFDTFCVFERETLLF